MRIQLKFGRDTMLALNELKILLFGDPNITVTQGYIVEQAYKLVKIDKIENPKDFWLELSAIKLSNIIETDDETIQGVKTTLNLDSETIDGINKLQHDFLTYFNNKRIHRAYVIKLILFAAILELK
ncbi:hypothetical protein KGP38_07260 [Lactococcus lactis]|uniref:hypothetical protein n=1 Tax=Lactococcus TaxID=1357 RepID=UPI001C1FFE82|nr:hypothetical protein [Lactococcus lactis]MBU7542395.1 hypothetical protein [Lactococcus lactis]